jgi:hypothetical protein
MFCRSCFVDRVLSSCTFSFGHCAVCSSSIYGFDYPSGIFKLFSQYNGKCEMTKRQINNGTQHTAISLRGICYCLFISVLSLEIQLTRRRQGSHLPVVIGDPINKEEERIPFTRLSLEIQLTKRTLESH